MRKAARRPETPTAAPLVSVENLSISYGKTHAVRGLSFGLQRGEVFGPASVAGMDKPEVPEQLIEVKAGESGKARFEIP